MHKWGEDGVDWDGIDSAASYIGTNLIRFGRVRVSDMKEKYGTVRVYCSFGWYQLHCITHPNYAYNQYPKWLWNIDCNYLSKVIPLMNWFIVPYQKLLYSYFYNRAIRKWPHLKQEILDSADWSELLEHLK